MVVADTKERILESARLTVQDLGYSGLSFRELAKDVGIKSASIHYYFANFALYLKGLLDEGLDTRTCMARYTDVYANTLRDGNRICLANILAAERNDLPAEVQVEVVKFEDMVEDWISMVLAMNKSTKPKEIKRRARAIFAAVAGAQLVAHSRGDVSVYEEIITTFTDSGFIP